jgi:predicted methyltransferase
MRLSVRHGVVIAALALALPPAASAQTPTNGNAVAAALASPDRPDADMQRDPDRHPMQLVTFAGIKAGDTVAELMPGGGYFTRIFSALVGAKGKVYAIMPSALAAKSPERAEALKTLASGQKLDNVTAVLNSADDFKVRGADVAWTTQNYHDLYALLGPDGTEAYVRAVYAALKPGGVFLVSDHVALPGAADAPGTLHRIDPAIVRTQLRAAGFVPDGESDALRNPADDHTLKVFDPAIRGKTDQFVMRFRKPAG